MPQMSPFMWFCVLPFFLSFIAILLANLYFNIHFGNLEKMKKKIKMKKMAQKWMW